MNFESIKQNITERMAKYETTFHATLDEIKIAWLVSEIERLRELRLESQCPNLIHTSDSGCVCELTGEDPFEGP